jgi:hypothetical protein
LRASLRVVVLRAARLLRSSALRAAAVSSPRRLSSQRQSMSPETVARKLFLMANKRLWVANPGVLLPQLD